MPERHDAGGKSRLSLLPGVTGDALFAGDRDEYRLWLSRVWDESGHSGLSIGMNPSTAEKDVDDLTLRKDQGFMRREGMGSMHKVNLVPYRLTDPAQLPRGVSLDHPENLPTIRRLAAGASLVLVATGKPPPPLIGYARAVFSALRADGVRMKCLGLTNDHWPRHTSRVGYDVPLGDFVW